MFCKGNKGEIQKFSKTARFDYQPLLGKMSAYSPPPRVRKGAAEIEPTKLREPKKYQWVSCDLILIQATYIMEIIIIVNYWQKYMFYLFIL